MPTDLTPGSITTLGSLRPGDAGEYAGNDERFIVVKNDSPPWVRIEYADGQRSVKTSSLIVRYLGRGRIEPARIVMEGEPDRIRELEAGLTWTDAKPTVPGWYWFRTDADCEPTVSYYDTKNWFGREWMAQLDGQFAGPIPTPKETPAK